MISPAFRGMRHIGACGGTLKIFSVYLLTYSKKCGIMSLQSKFNTIGLIKSGGGTGPVKPGNLLFLRFFPKYAN